MSSKSLKNYEWEKFQKGFLGGCLLLDVILIILLHFFPVAPMGLVLLGMIQLGGQAFLYYYIRSMMKKTYDAVSELSGMMVRVIEHEKLPDEIYLQGDIGSLYTNFYKMVYILKETKEEVQKEKVFLQDVISDISHQLKTPLASLKVFMNLLEEDRVTKEEQRKQIIEESSNQLTRMEWMVLSMLKLSRIEAGAIQFEKQDRDVEELVKEAVAAVEYLTSQRKQQVTIQVPAQMHMICDGPWLVEALINLLKNASDYSEEGKEIHVVAEENAMFSRISVEDEGMGIPEEALGHIFERFYRVNNEVNPNSVGIGLSLVKSIVEGQGGQISVRSKLGEYTKFRLTFVRPEEK